MWEDVPREVIGMIFSFLNKTDLGRLAKVSKSFWQWTSDYHLWKDLLKRRFPDIEVSDADDPKLVYRRFDGIFKNFLKGTFKMSSMRDAETPPFERPDRENAIFSVIPSRSSELAICGGSVPNVSVMSWQEQKTVFRLAGSSGLCLGFDEESGIVAGGGFQGSLSIWKGFRWDAKSFLKSQSVRYLKQQLASRKKGWQDLQEKDEMIDKLLGSFQASNEEPCFGPVASVQASNSGLVDVLVTRGGVLYSAGWDTQIRVWKVSDRQCDQVGHLEGHQLGCNAIRSASSDADRIISAGSDGTVRVWSAEQQKCMRTLPLSDSWLWCLDCKEDPLGNVVWTAGVDHHIRLLDTRADGTVMGSFLCPAEVSGLQTLPCSHLLASSCFDGRVRLFDSRNIAKPLNVITCSFARLTRCAITERVIMAGGFDGSVYVLNFENEKVK